MKTLLITFAVLLAVLTLISAFGGSLSRERFEEEPMPFLENEKVGASTENFWEEQQKHLVESFMEEKENEKDSNSTMLPEHSQENVEPFATCGSQKENFSNGKDIEPYEDDSKTYGAF